jgi:drug/metabolite transporter (DMT)-like permease
LVLGASFLYAIGNFIDELLIDDFEQPIGTLVMISGLFGGVIAIGFGAYALLFAIPLHLPLKLLLLALLIGVLEVAWLPSYLQAIKNRGALIAGPIFQAVPVIAFAFEFVTGSLPRSIQIAGALVIVGGGLLLSIEEDEENNTTSVDWKTVLLMSLSVVIVSVIYILFKEISGLDGYATVGFWSGIGMLLTTIFLWVFWAPYRADFNEFCRETNLKAFSLQIVNEFADAGGVYLTHYANVIGPSVALVTAFNATQPVFILIIGAILTWVGIIKSQKRSSFMHFLIVMGIMFIALGTVLVSQ